jgi:hypothetical protein
MHKNATKCNKTESKWCINKHGASKIIDTFETYQTPPSQHQKSILSKRDDFKKEIVHKHRCHLIIDLRFSPWRKSSLIKIISSTRPLPEAQSIKVIPWIFTLQGKILNFSCVVTPTFGAAAPSHESRSQFNFTPKLEPPLTVHRSWLP